MKTTWLLVILFIAGIVHGGELRVSTKEPIFVVAPDGWKAVKERTPMPLFPFETYRIAPAGNRNVACMISFFEKDKPEFADPAFLKKLIRMDSRPYVGSPSELSKVDVKELKINGGFGFYANFVDPDLVGKPVQKGNYETATPVIVSVSSKYLVKATVLCDEIDGADYRDGMAIVKSLKLKKTD